MYKMTINLLLTLLLVMSNGYNYANAEDNHGQHSSGSSSSDDDSSGSSSSAGSHENELVTYGAISAISPTSISVGDNTFAITSSTELKGHHDEVVTIDAFSVGDVVKVEAENSSNNQLIAHEIELSGRDDFIGSQGGLGNAASEGSANSSKRRAQCSFPELNLVSSSIERAAAKSLFNAGVNAKVKVKVSLSKRSKVSSLSAIDVIKGIVVTANNSGDVSLSGAVEADPCTAILNIRTTVGSGRSAIVSTSQLPISGVIGVKK